MNMASCRANLRLNSLNARGLANPKKRRTLFQWLKRNYPGVTFLQETHTTLVSETQWKKEWGGDIEFSHGSCGSRGVAILFPPKMDVTINSKSFDTLGRLLLLDTTIDDQNIILINVYAPTKDKPNEQIEFLQTIKDKCSDITDKNIVIGGDLNTYLNPKLDKKGGIENNETTNFSKEVQAFCEGMNLIDVYRVINPDLRRYTWRGMTKRGNVSSRLDYWLISTHMLYDFVETGIKPSINSDHSLITLTFQLSDTEMRGRGFWKFNTDLLRDENYVAMVKNKITELNAKYETFNNKSLLWDVIKCELRSETISYSAFKSKERKKIELQLQTDLNNLEIDLDNGKDVKTEYNSIKAELEQINAYKANGVFIRSKASWIEDGEKNTKLFLQIEKRNFNSKYIKALQMDNGDIVKGKDKILAEEERYYKLLYKAQEVKSCKNNCSLLENNIPSLTNVDKQLCDMPITIIECAKSLSELPNNKTPGSDGFSCEFYKFFWQDLKIHIFQSFSYSFENNELSVDQRRAILTLLPKSDKDIRLLKNWRPISLLNTDYKILAKLLANRLQKVIPSLVSEDQSGYIKGRYIGENIRLILDIIEYTNLKINPGIIIFLDFEKAFDSISWDFLFKTLNAFNFGEYFLSWIKILYNKPLSCVSNNGHATQFFEISRGIRQGCPISALLFILVAEIMSINIRNNEKIEGVCIGNKTVCITQLADDTSLFLKNKESILTVFTLLNHFENCAGLKLNKEKTHAIMLGSVNDINVKNLGIKIVTESIKTLGIYVGKNEDITLLKTLNEKVSKVKNLLNMWKARNLSIKGKITILRSQALPLILYPASVLFVPDKTVKELESIFYDFIWPNKKHHVKKQVLKQEIENGGLKMPCIYSMIKSVKLKWIQTLINKNNNFVTVAKASIKINEIEIWLASKNTTKYLQSEPSKFYKQILDFWEEIHCTEPITHGEILQESLWNNSFILIDRKPANITQMKAINIKKLGDIIHHNGKFKEKCEIEAKFQSPIDVMNFNSIKSAIPKHWINRLIAGGDNYIETEHNANITVKINNKHKSLCKIKCKEFYWEFVNKTFTTSKAVQTWEEYYYYCEFDWKTIFRAPYLYCRETSVQSMQYQIVNRYFPCGSVLNTWYKTDGYKCEFCSMEDSLEHYFFDCQSSFNFWVSFKKWWKSIFKCEIGLSAIDVLLGIVNYVNDKMLDCLNFCILYGKKYIVDSKKAQSPLFFYDYQVKLKCRLEIEEYIYISNGAISDFENKWSIIVDLL